MSEDPFAQQRAVLSGLEAQLDQVWIDLDRVLPKLLEHGGPAAADHYRANMFRLVDRIRHDWAERRQDLPPFTTYKDGIFYRHPVTDENCHLLKRL